MQKPTRPRVESERSRWRQAQSQRHRGQPMTFRGRLTVLALACFAFAGLFSSGSCAQFSTPGGASLAAVSAPYRSSLPPEIFERLPVASDSLALAARVLAARDAGDAAVSPTLTELVELPAGGDSPAGAELRGDLTGPLRIDYTLDAELTRRVFRVLRRARVKLGHVILLDPGSGRILAYASTDVARFPPTRAYPAASLIKVVTAAAALDRTPEIAAEPCRYSGNPYRLTRTRIDPPRRGRSVSFRRALATSNNQCFAQLAVHAVGEQGMLDAVARFGLLAEPAPGHAAGSVDVGADRYDLGRLGCGLAGCRITPLHAAQLAAVLADGRLVAPHWIERVTDAAGNELRLPKREPPKRVLSPELARELRSMLVDTTVRGTARSAFRGRRGRPLLGPVQVAGKTGSLSGKDPDGRYEWFIGVAPAAAPKLAISVVAVYGDLWWKNASQVAAEVLREVFCERGACSADAALRWTERPARSANAAVPRTPDA